MPGLDRSLVQGADVDLLFKRIRKDSRSDLIAAPHYDALFERGADRLWSRVSQELSSGLYEPDLPIGLSVPKPRGFNRAGAILHPLDRVVYQFLADTIATTIEANVDRSRVFSNVLLEPDPDGDLFEAHSTSYERFKGTLINLCDRYPFFVAVDVANYYDQIPQHAVVNMLQSTGAHPSAVNLLEAILQAFRQRSSVGLIQGLAPSDLLGNFYLSNFDYQCEMEELESCRFVDDVYIAVPNYESAKVRLTWAIERLRRDALYLNELKSGVRGSDIVRTSENEINRQFAEAVESANESGVMDYIDDAYGFRVEVGDPLAEEDLSNIDSEAALAAIQRLINAVDPLRFDMTARIDKFSFPILTTLQSDIAIDRAPHGIISRPYLAQSYAIYLSRFVFSNTNIANAISQVMRRFGLGNYERMLLILALLNAAHLDTITVGYLLSVLVDVRIPEPVRAVAAIVACKFGNAQQQRQVRTRYEDETSPYMRAALLYSAQFMSPGDRNTCRRLWGTHSVTNSILASIV